MTSCGRDRASIAVRGSEIECVDEFVYLGSLIVVNGRLDAEVDRRVANASKAFGALHRAVFDDSNLSLAAKRKVYNSCVLSMDLNAGQCYVDTLIKRLNGFHHRCIHTVLKITNKQQWEQHIASSS